MINVSGATQTINVSGSTLTFNSIVNQLCLYMSSCPIKLHSEPLRNRCLMREFERVNNLVNIMTQDVMNSLKNSVKEMAVYLITSR